MKSTFLKFLTALAVALATLTGASSAFADAYQMSQMQRNTTDTGYTNRILDDHGHDGILIYSFDILQPAYAVIGPNLDLSHGTLSVTGISAAGLSGSYTDLTNKPTLTTGPAGSAGTNGTNGTNGADGATGPTGATGPKGDTGLTGSAGTNGAAGSAGSAGAKGDTGATGAAGSNGTNGTNGTNATVKGYAGTVQKTGVFPIFKSATVASGVAVYNLTDDGLSTGNALCTEVLADSVQVTVSDATASYQMGWAFTNSNKTLTVTANKLTTSNILTGLLGQAAANGAVVKLSVYCD